MSNDSIMRVAKAIQEENSQISMEDAIVFVEYMVMITAIDNMLKDRKKEKMC